MALMYYVTVLEAEKYSDAKLNDVLGNTNKERNPGKFFTLWKGLKLTSNIYLKFQFSDMISEEKELSEAKIIFGSSTSDMY